MNKRIKYHALTNHKVYTHIANRLNWRFLGATIQILENQVDNHEKAIAEGIHSGAYSWERALLVSEMQGLNWVKVDQEYGKLYEAEQVAGANKWN